MEGDANRLFQQPAREPSTLNSYGGIVVQPGQSFVYQATRSFDRAGTYTFVMAWRDQAGTWRNIPGAPGVANTASLTIGDCQPAPVVTGSLTVNPVQPTINGIATVHAVITNRGCKAFSPNLIGAGGRGPGGDSDIMDFPLLPNVSIAPGQSWEYSAVRTFPREGNYGFGMVYRDQNGNFHDIPSDGAANRSTSIHVGGCGPNFLVTSSLVLSPSDPMVGEPVTATFAVTNTGCEPFAPKLIGAGGRGPGGDPDVQDFPLLSGVVIQPGETYIYSATRAYNEPGPHSAGTYYLAVGGDGHDLPAAPGVVRNVTVQVTTECLPRPVVTGNLTISPNPASTGAAISATFEITNKGCADFAPEALGVAARGPNGENEDIDWQHGIVVPPNGTFLYTAHTTFAVAGPTHLWTDYLDTRTGWHGGIPAAPGVVWVTDIQVNACTPRPVAVSDLVFSPNPGVVGEPVTASVAIRNTGCADLVAEALGVEGFPAVQNLTIPAGQTYQYQQTRTFDTPGDYGGGISYKLPNGGFFTIVHDTTQIDWAALRIDAAPTEPPTAVPVTEPPTTEPTLVPTAESPTEVPPTVEVPTSTPVFDEPAEETPTVTTEPELVPTSTPVFAEPTEQPTSEPEPTSEPGVIAASASSTYGAGADKAIDGDPTTAWIEGASGVGIGESLTIAFGQTLHLTSLTIVNGLALSDDAYAAYGAVAALSVTSSGGDSVQLTLDHTAQPQSFAVDLTGDAITLAIADVFPGAIFPDDTALGEIAWGTGETATTPTAESTESTEATAVPTESITDEPASPAVAPDAAGEAATMPPVTETPEPTLIPTVTASATPTATPTVPANTASTAKPTKTPAAGKVEITRRDGKGRRVAGSCILLEGARTYGPICDNAKADGSKTKGIIRLSAIAPGDYTLTETTTPNGLAPAASQTVRVTSRRTTRITLRTEFVPTAVPTEAPPIVPVGDAAAATESPTEPAANVTEIPTAASAVSGETGTVRFVAAECAGTNAPAIVALPLAAALDPACAPVTGRSFTLLLPDGSATNAAAGDERALPTGSYTAFDDETGLSLVFDLTADGAQVLVTVPAPAVEPTEPSGGIVSTGDAGTEPTAEPEPAPTPAPTEVTGAEIPTAVPVDEQPTSGTLPGRLAFGLKQNGHWDVWLADIATGDTTQLTTDPNSDQWAPSWSHDGSRLAYLSDETDGSNQIWLMTPDGSDQHQISQWSGTDPILYVAWAGDDRSFIVTVGSGDGMRLMTMPADGGELTEFIPAPASVASVDAAGEIAYAVSVVGDLDIQIADASGAPLATAANAVGNEDAPSLSPDGSRVAYQFGEPGRRQVQVIAVNGGEPVVVSVSSDASNPVWSPDGTWLAYVDNAAGDQIVLVNPDTGETYTLATPPHDRIWYLAWGP